MSADTARTEPQAERAPEGPGESADTISQAGERRSTRIESLRALAALAVVFAHVAGTQAVPFLPAEGALGKVQGFGFAGVYFFFALTGYLLFWPFVKQHFGTGEPVALGRYAVNRGLRILPLYYAVIAFAIVVLEDGGTLRLWGRFLTMTENFNPDTIAHVVPTAWSLVVEVHFYILLPLLAYLLARVTGRSRVAAAGILLGLAAISLAIRFEKTAQPLWLLNMPGAFLFFVPGMLVALLRLGWEQRPPRLTGLAARADVWLIASLPLWVFFVFHRPDVNPSVLGAGFLVIGACVLPLQRGRITQLLTWRYLAILGVASYSLYLWHLPLMQVLIRDFNVPTSFGWLTLIAVPICIVVALLSYRFIEAPFLRLRKQWSRAAAPKSEQARPGPGPAAASEARP